MTMTIPGKLKPREPETIKEPGMYHDGLGLYLQVTTGAKGKINKSWLFRYHVEGRGDRQMGLGPLHTIGLAQARELARQCRERRLNGIDPIDAREAARLDQKLAAAKIVPFRDCFEGWMKMKDRGWTRDHVAEVARDFKLHINHELGALPVQKIDVDALHRALKTLHDKAPATYREVRQHIEAALDWAHAKGYIPPGNPASEKGLLGHLLPPVWTFHDPKPHEALPWQQMGAFMALLRAHKTSRDPAGGSHAPACRICNSPHRDEIEAARRAGTSLTRIEARYDIYRQSIMIHERWRAAGGTLVQVRPVPSCALEFIILTAVRKGQAIKARWEDIDWEEKIWNCGLKHKVGKKTGQDHIVPLSDAAMAVLTEMRGRSNGGEFVFPGGNRTQSGHISATVINKFMDRVLVPTAPFQEAIASGKISGKQDKRGKWRTDATVHGFRTGFGNWSVEHGYDERDSEMALAHMVGTGVRNIYKREAKRIEPRRLMMQAWAEHCGRTEPLPADVIPFRQAK